MLDSKSPAHAITDRTPRRTGRGWFLWCGGCGPILKLGLLALALSVTLWGYASKLSVFEAFSGGTSPATPAAKLWIEHRFGFSDLCACARASSDKQRNYAQAGADALFTPSPEAAFNEGQVAPMLIAQPRAVPFFHSAIPLRSPPAISL